MIATRQNNRRKYGESPSKTACATARGVDLEGEERSGPHELGGEHGQVSHRASRFLQHNHIVSVTEAAREPSACCPIVVHPCELREGAARNSRKHSELAVRHSVRHARCANSGAMV